MKRYALLCLLLTLTGCATERFVSPGQNWRPANYSGPAWEITGSIDRNEDLQGVHALLTVAINGDPVIRNYLGTQYTGEFGGTYQGRAVSSVCTSKQEGHGYITVSCMILIDNERAATLVF